MSTITVETFTDHDPKVLSVPVLSEKKYMEHPDIVKVSVAQTFDNAIIYIIRFATARTP